MSLLVDFSGRNPEAVYHGSRSLKTVNGDPTFNVLYNYSAKSMYPVNLLYHFVISTGIACSNEMAKWLIEKENPVSSSAQHSFYKKFLVLDDRTVC